MKLYSKSMGTLTFHLNVSSIGEKQAELYYVLKYCIQTLVRLATDPTLFP